MSSSEHIADDQAPEPSFHGGQPTVPDASWTAPYVQPARGHYCLHEQRGEVCPGPEGCSTVAAEVTANPCNKGGVRDGFRCTNCGRWHELAEGISHRHPSCVVAPPKRGRR